MRIGDMKVYIEQESIDALMELSSTFKAVANSIDRLTNALDQARAAQLLRADGTEASSDKPENTDVE